MKPKILIVDDSRPMRQILRRSVQMALEDGVELRDAEHGAAALKALAEEPVDLVLTDVNMPRMDGITLVAQLRTLPSYHFTPLLLLTTESSQERKMQGKQAGATGWMVKPFNPDQLLATLERVLGNKTALRA